MNYPDSKLRNFLLATLLILMSQVLSAQVAVNIKPAENSKMGEFSDWSKVDVSFDDGSSATIEYRVALVARKGVGCHYDLEVKNTSEGKLDIAMKSSYYDKMVKKHFGDKISETVKPGKSVVGRFIAQGCKKDKGVELDDVAACLACDFGLNIHVYQP